MITKEFEHSPRTALVTGGTDGIGKEIARGLARAGCRVVVVGRDAEKGKRAAEEIRNTAVRSQVEFLQADLSLMREVERLSVEITRRFAQLSYLVLCAGIVRGRRQLTSEEIESNFAVNYLSRFLLTEKLLPLLNLAGRPGKTSRIVLIGGASQVGKIHFDDINLTRNFNTIRMVMQFARANDVFTLEQARRLANKGRPNTTITCLKIGVVKTNIRQEFPLWMKWLVPLLFDPLFGQTPHQAAESALRLLLDEEFEGLTGALFLKIKKFKRVEPVANPSPAEEGCKLWDLSERFVRKALMEDSIPPRFEVTHL